MGLLSRIVESVLDNVATKAGRAADVAQSRGYSDQAKLDHTRSQAARAGAEAEELKQKRAAQERMR